MSAVFKVDNIEFPNIRVIALEQSFEILDGEKSGRSVLTGVMNRQIIGSYYNYKLKLKPKYTPQGMKEYNQLWHICSQPVKSHMVTVPDDVTTNITSSGVTHNSMTYEAYITSGKRAMLKYDIDGVDYWGDGEFNFVAINPNITA